MHRLIQLVKISLSHSILTNPTLWQITTTSTGGGSIYTFINFMTKNTYFIPKEDNRVTEESKSDSIVFGQSGCEVRKQLLLHH